MTTEQKTSVRSGEKALVRTLGVCAQLSGVGWVTNIRLSARLAG